ncbi:MAG TPA: hypothetical protein VI757_07165, partial [Bacteroidia bacterium]|nr:hypothetical protein [Bacteroidia bacterium]
NLTRAVMFLGHKFSNRISFFSELEVEDAKMEGGEEGGELAFEQLFLKFNLSKDIYLSAGLFTPRMGIINENHLPTTYNGNNRPYVERYLIPATWRELGVCLYGKSNKLPGFNYTFGIMNGLNSAGFKSGTGIRGGRFEGRDATASNLAVTGSLLYYAGHFRIQASGCYGGSAGLSDADADTFNLDNGTFGTPVLLTEANIQYENKGFSLRALATMIQIPDAEKINSAYDNDVAKAMVGFYGEIGYNFLRLCKKETQKNLTLFIRYESLDLNNELPTNLTKNNLLVSSYVTAGLIYQPVKGVAVKADYVSRTTGKPDPAPSPFHKTNGFFNLGFGYSF